jgi:hypothetical protein
MNETTDPFGAWEGAPLVPQVDAAGWRSGALSLEEAGRTLEAANPQQWRSPAATQYTARLEELRLALSLALTDCHEAQYLADRHVAMTRDEVASLEMMW